MSRFTPPSVPKDFRRACVSPCAAIVFLALLSSWPGAAQLSKEAEAARKKNSPEAISLYQRALRADPRWQDGWWALGTLEYQKDHYPQCRDAFGRLSELAPASGLALAMLGLCENGNKEYDAALDHLKRGLEHGINNDAIMKTARFHLARLYTRAGMFEPALGVIAQLTETVPESPVYLQLAGAAALWMPVFPEDIPSADRELVYLSGLAFWHAGSRYATGADKDMEELVSRYPSARGVHYLRGSYELRSNPDRAITEFEAELKNSPGHPGALAALAAEYLRRGDAAKGLPYGKTLAQELPEGVASHALLGRLLAESGDLAGGVLELEKARDLEPTDPQPHISLASLYAKLGRTADAAREREAFMRAKDGHN